MFASANQTQMTVVTDAGLQAGDPPIFTENVLEIAVPKGNPGNVTGLADFGNADLTLAVCAADVPCGAAAAEVFADAGITAQPDTEEEDVKAALTKVQLGEVDAALVYATDVQAAGDEVEGIPFPEAEQAINNYPICVLKAAPNPDAAQAFVDLVHSDDGQQALEDAGFRRHRERPVRRARRDERRPAARCCVPAAARRRLPGAAAGRAAGPRAVVGDRARSWPQPEVGQALRLSLVSATAGHR